MKLRTLFILVATLVLAVACSRGPRQIRPRIDPELLQLPKEQIFQRAEDQFAKEKWQKARTYYQFVYESFPNDPLGRRSLLRIADTFYKQGGPINLVEAQYKYRDFINRYPTSEQADYAMLQIAMCSYKQMEKADRDQTKTREALQKFDEMLVSHPRSPLVDDAKAKKQDVLDRLGKHEHMIARYYMKRKSWVAATQRLNHLIDSYPAYNERDAAFFDLGTALDKLGRGGEARLYFERVISEFPSSDYADRAKRRLDNIKA